MGAAASSAVRRASLAGFNRAGSLPEGKIGMLAQANAPPSVKAVVGTLNFLGDDYNPLQFSPSRRDIELAGLTVEEWEQLDKEAAAIFCSFTIGQCRENLDSAVSAATARGSAEGSFETVQRVLNSFLDSQGLTDELEVWPLIRQRKLDLHLDNKWLPGPETPTRLNPIVFALHDFGSTTQRAAVLSDPLTFRLSMLAFYAAKCPEDPEDIDPTSLNQLLSLLIWDFLCAWAVVEARDAFDRLSRCSHLVDPASGEPLSGQERLHRLCDPLEQFVGQYAVDQPVILGCQELPTSAESLEVIRAALPPGFVLSRPTAADTTGFIHRESLQKDFKDVSMEIRSQLAAYLKGTTVPSKVQQTTLRRTLCGVYNISKLASCPYNIAVVNFHCKSFKKLVREQATFISVALDCAANIEGVHQAVVVGDMNLEAAWPPGTTAQAQTRGILDSQVFHIPVANQKNLGPFRQELEQRGLQAFPKMEVFTTLKKRTRFQAQPEKEGEISVAHKDFVIARSLDPSEDVRILKISVGGRDDDSAMTDGNLALLQPSRIWPGDHFAVLCIMQFGNGNSSAAARRTVAVKTPGVPDKKPTSQIPTTLEEQPSTNGTESPKGLSTSGLPPRRSSDPGSIRKFTFSSKESFSDWVTGTSRADPAEEGSIGRNNLFASNASLSSPANSSSMAKSTATSQP